MFLVTNTGLSYLTREDVGAMILILLIFTIVYISKQFNINFTLFYDIINFNEKKYKIN